jgi:hypothetical protein
MAEICPGDLNGFLFPSGGGEANEAAIRMARLYTGKQKIFTQYRWVSDGTYEDFCWDLWGFYGIYWDLMGFMGILWDLLGFNGIYGDFMELTWNLRFFLGFFIGIDCESNAN